MLIVASIDSIRNLPASALFGSALVFFFLASACFFLVPTALVAAELAATFPEKGGVYYWVYRAFGEKTALLAIWLQWINTMVWYPTILSFLAGTAAYLICPELVQNKVYLISFILLFFWSLTFLNFKGIHFSLKINSFCGIIGTLIPMSLLIILGGVWFFSGKPLQIALNSKTLIPSFSDTTSWISLIAIMASFLGMELAGIHVNDIRNPQKNFPKAVLLSSFIILITMLFGSLAVAFVVQADQINLISGVMQVFSCFFQAFDLVWLMPILAVMIVVGIMGSIINWLISPAKGLLHAAEFGYLPPFFTKKNREGVPVRILLAQAIL
ncbi:MAG: amino acid permease, partial [Chlamydiae bacterium]|nr:amino acid permease [Chlamydiota bacterium]